MTIQELAEQTRAEFENVQRNVEPFNYYWRRKQDENFTGAEDWVTNMVRKAHGDLLPDDYKYQFIADALDIISGDLLDTDLDDLSEQVDADVDVNDLDDLLRWIGSGGNRAEYVEEGVNEFLRCVLAQALRGVACNGFDFFKALQVGQYREREEVLNSVLSSLRNRLEEIEEKEIIQSIGEPARDR